MQRDDDLARVSRLALAADRGAVTTVLARAFHDDPVYRFVLPDPDRRARLLPVLVHALIYGLHRGMGPVEVLGRVGRVVGVAVWDAPGAVAPGATRTLRALPAIARALGPRMLQFRALGEAAERMRPVTPHRYLFHLGADPDHQGAGVGSGLLRPALAAADGAEDLVHLETRPGNVGYYERWGFEVTGAVPFDAVELVAMTRSPQPNEAVR